MATSKEEQVVVNGAGQEQQPEEETADRRHVEALLDLSEEDFLRDLEPRDYHVYPGWEEAVRGWDRVAPLSCILLTVNRPEKAKHQEAPLSVDPTIPKAESPASIARPCCDSHLGSQNGFRRSTPLHLHTGPCRGTAVAALQTDSTEWPTPNTMQKNTSAVLLREKIEEEMTHHLTSKCSLSEIRPNKSQKHSCRSNNKAIPIKNYNINLPPVERPNLHPHKVSCSGRKAADGETTENNCLMIIKKCELRAPRTNPTAYQEPFSAGLTSKYRTFEQSPLLFSAGSVSVPKRHQVHVTSTRNAMHHTLYSMGKSTHVPM